MIVSAKTVYSGFQRLLEEGAYAKSQKFENKGNHAADKIYWCSVTAVYLGWSFITMEWENTWIIWPIAGVFYGAAVSIASFVKKTLKS